jgi:hypothetical protein
LRTGKIRDIGKVEIWRVRPGRMIDALESAIQVPERSG